MKEENNIKINETAKIFYGMNKSIITSIIIAIAIIGGAILLTSNKNSDQNLNGNGSIDKATNVSIVDGIQIIELYAKGGYSPRRSVAQAGIPTIIRFETKSTFDCSLSVRIPSLNLSQFLVQTGDTDIDIGIQPVGLFRGSCGMGMYPFEIDFI